MKQSQTVKTSVLKQITSDNCGQCNEPRGEHSKKNMIRCMYKADATLYEALVKITELEGELEKLKNKDKDNKDDESGS